MTNEELRQQYRLMQLVAEHGVRSYHALDAGGHVCMVHYLPGPSPETTQLLALLDTLAPGDQTRILERLQVDGAPVVVTENIPGFQSLAAWLQTRSARADAAPPAPPSAARRVGEFTQLFGPASNETPAPPQRSPLPPPAPSRPEPRAPAPVAPPTAAAPPARPASGAPSAGGLTQLFGPTDGSTAPASDVTLPILRAAPPARTESPPASPPAPADPARRAGAGEFTQLFGPGGAGPTGPPSASTGDATPTRPTERPPEPPDPNTPSIRWRDNAASPERPVVRWRKEGEGASHNAPPPSPPAHGAPPAPPRPPGVPGVPRSQPAGEFTQLFGARGAGPDDPRSGASTPPTPPAPPAPDPWAPSRAASPFGPPAPSSGAASPPRGITPGEFTRLFQPEKGLGMPSANAPPFFPEASVPAPSAPPPPAPPPVVAPPPGQPAGEFTRLMGGGGASGLPGGSAAPGDFTRMISAVPAPASPAKAAPAASAPDATPERRSGRLVVLLIALGVLGIVAVALVVYLALK